MMMSRVSRLGFERGSVYFLWCRDTAMSRTQDGHMGLLRIAEDMTANESLVRLRGILDNNIQEDRNEEDRND
jgi:hypothetical protein